MGLVMGLWSAWVSRLWVWVWVVVGCGAVDRHDGFDFVEVCRGGFVCVCVCVCVLLADVMGLPLCLSSFFSPIWVLWLWWWLICDLEEEGSGWAIFSFFFFLVVVVARMDMGLLSWDGRVWVCWIDRWVWVVGFFYSGGGWGRYGFAALRLSSLLGWEWQWGRERKKYSWRIKK